MDSLVRWDGYGWKFLVCSFVHGDVISDDFLFGLYFFIFADDEGVDFIYTGKVIKFTVFKFKKPEHHQFPWFGHNVQ